MTTDSHDDEGIAVDPLTIAAAGLAGGLLAGALLAGAAALLIARRTIQLEHAAGLRTATKETT